jgi:hypothetical protein
MGLFFRYQNQSLYNIFFIPKNNQSLTYSVKEFLYF